MAAALRRAARAQGRGSEFTVFLATGLPGMDGGRVAATLLIAISGYAEEARSKKCGIDHRLVKPFDFPRLREPIAGRPAPDR